MAFEVDSTNLFHAQTTLMKWVTMWPASFKNNLTKLAVDVFSWSLTVLLAGVALGLFTKALTTKNLVAQSEAIYMLTLVGTSVHRIRYYKRHHSEMSWLFQRGRLLARGCPKGWLNYTGILSHLYCLAGFFCITLWVTGPLIEDLTVRRSVQDTKIPVSIYIPVEISGLLFWAVYFVCCISVITAAHVYLAADTFFFTMIHVANGAIETLRRKLRDMHTLDIEANPDLALAYLKNIIKDHVFTLEYLRMIDSKYRPLISFDVLHGIISLTFAILSLSESKSIMEWMKMVLFVGYCVFHQFCNSFFGQHLTDQQDKLFEDLHTVPWTDGDAKFRKIFHITQTGMKKPIMLSAWRVYYLQYRTFMEFSKSILSYYMVLRQVLHQK